MKLSWLYQCTEYSEVGDKATTVGWSAMALIPWCQSLHLSTCERLKLKPKWIYLHFPLLFSYFCQLLLFPKSSVSSPPCLSYKQTYCNAHMEHIQKHWLYYRWAPQCVCASFCKRHLRKKLQHLALE